MAIAIAGSMVGAVLSSTLPKLISEIEKKLKKKAELKNLVDSFKTQLGLIKADIRNHNNVTDKQKAFIKSLRCLAYDMEDCIESCNDAKPVRRKKLEEKIRKLKFAVDVTSGLYDRMATEAADQPQGQDGASSSNTSAQTSCNPRTIEQEDKCIPLVDLVGKEKNLDELLDLMRIPQSPLEMKLKVIVISIVGFPGVGKTLLANQVYNEAVKYSESRSREKFSRHVLIDAADKDNEKVIEAILRELRKQQGVQRDGTGTRASDKAPLQEETRIHADPSSSTQQAKGCMNEDIQKQRLKSYIGNNRYLIVVDNVSEELGRYMTSAFPENGKGSRIILITMTIEGSATESCGSDAGHVSKMRPLKVEKSVNIFLEEATKLERQPHIAIEEEEAVQKICDGVPLALVSVSEVRHGELESPFEVSKAWEQLGRKVEARRWLRRMDLLLPHCYGSLSMDLQACLLYFSMFPGGSTVRRGSLIRRWQAEGPEFGCTTAKRTENLESLVKRNFVWPLQVSMNHRDDDKPAGRFLKEKTPTGPPVKTCQSPGLILNYIIKKSESEEFIMLSCDEREIRDIRRLSLHAGDSSSHNAELILREKSMSRLRTLAIFRENQQTKRLSFEKCDVLRVLDLEACHDLSEDHLKEICSFLKLLKYLSLPASIEKVPSKIAKLRLLQTLDLGKEKVVTVPVDVLWLPYLKHLLGKCELCADYSSKENLIKFLSGSGENKDKYSKLETLAGFVIRKKKGLPQLLRHMVQLRKVKIWFNSDEEFKGVPAHRHGLTEGIKEFCRRASTDANDGVGSASLKIDLQRCSPKLLDSLDVTGCKLFYLKVNCGCVWTTLRQLPSFIAESSVITRLCLSWITMDVSDILANLGNLQGLKYLKLVADNMVGSIVVGEDGTGQRELVIKREHQNSQNISKQFQSLQRMCLVARKRLDRIKIERKALPNLVSLQLIYQHLDDHSAKQISGLKTLKELVLHPKVKPTTKHAWRKVALTLPMKPQVLFSVSP
ncbi:unnamed protein product [Urochloa decumbens]|uniref:Uncharacterized protein n=1 Tax=Urochloa decumbens TaxID=240449 RepID=A0ABC9FJE9_9POAL